MNPREINASRLGQLLVQRNWITGEQLMRAIQSQRLVGGRIGTCLLEMDVLSEDLLLEALSEKLNVPPIRIEQLRGIPTTILEMVPPRVAQRCLAVPFSADDHEVRIATLDVDNLEYLDEIAFCTNRRVKPYIANEVRIFEALERYYGLECPRRYGHLLDRLNRSKYMWDESAKILLGATEDEVRVAWKEPDEAFGVGQILHSAASHSRHATGRYRKAENAQIEPISARNGADRHPRKTQNPHDSTEVHPGQNISLPPMATASPSPATVEPPPLPAPPTQAVEPEPQPVSVSLPPEPVSLPPESVSLPPEPVSPEPELVSPEPEAVSPELVSLEPPLPKTPESIELDADLVTPVDSPHASPAGNEVNEALEEIDQLLTHPNNYQTVGQILIQFMAKRFEHSLLFQVHGGEMHGWLGRGADLDLERFQKARFDLQLPSIFSALAKGSDHYLGPLAPMPLHRALAQCWGGALPKLCAAFPIRLRNRLVCAFYVDQGDGLIEPESVELLERLAQKGAMAFEVCILQKKIRQG